ncbi:hypothetical protein V6N13_026475 [Hibiscus sabdariffa]
MDTESWKVQEPSGLSSSVNVALQPIRWQRCLTVCSAINKALEKCWLNFLPIVFPPLYSSVDLDDGEELESQARRITISSSYGVCYSLCPGWVPFNLGGVGTLLFLIFKIY